MGVGDNIKKAAENAMEDLAGTSDPHDDAHVPEPGARDDDIQVHSSISEGSNAMDDADDYPEHQGASAGGLAERSDAPGALSDDPNQSASGASTEEREGDRTDRLPMGNPESPSGPAGLPGPDPEELHADPSEADEDPTSSMGRG